MLKLLIKLIFGGIYIMVDLYVALIVNKRRTIDQVPTQFKEPVLADLNALGLDGNGDPIVTE
jgi:hypothetical protein